MTMTQPPECPGHGPMTPGETTPDGRRWWDCPHHQEPARSSTLTDRIITQDDLEDRLGATVEDETDAPQCPLGHGQMIERTDAAPMSAWCGTWFDCPPGSVGETCRSAALIPSPELKALHESLLAES